MTADQDAQQTTPAHAADAVISVEKLVKKYGERTVLKGVSFDIAPGQVVALVGPSGGGKSTALRCMTGLEAFHEGAVRVGAAKLRPGALAENRAELARLRLESGLVFQTWHLFPHRTALENVYEAPVHVKRLPVELARNRAKLLLAKVGLSHREDAMPRNMSGGEQQRCAIARALAMEPKVLFMDEPTSALDPQRVGDLVELLDHLKRSEKLTFVIVTHEMKFAEKLADRTLVLFEGHVIEDGHPRDILVAPKDPRTRTFLGLEDA
jgi:ABC-type polar amino acid transport system ATPase subunit